MNKIKNNIEAVIFDLGGVILDIDIDKIKLGFKSLGFEQLEKSFELFKQNQTFEKFERGEISPQDFRNEIRKACPKPFSDSRFNTVWNSILLNYPSRNIALLKEVKNNYRTFLLSNTNQIHYEYYTKMLNDNFKIKKLDDLFEKAYYSHTSGLRKPNLEFFKRVINENNLEASKTVFIDDFPENIAAAKQLGIKTILLNGIKLNNVFEEQGKLLEKIT